MTSQITPQTLMFPSTAAFALSSLTVTTFSQVVNDPYDEEYDPEPESQRDQEHVTLLVGAVRS